MSAAKPKVLVVVGPTASGKTSLSIKLAKEISGEVISADSRQVYRSLDIGTEKVSAEEMDGIPHHLIDVIEPDQVYSATDYANDGQAAIKTITNKGNLPIVAGGTFFYIDALLGKMNVPAAPPDPKLRKELETLPLSELQSRLEKLDPSRAADIDMQNPRRVMRSIEIASTLGHVPELPEPKEIYDVLTIGIDTPKEVLRERIRNRAQQALTRGLIEETKELLNNGLTRERLSEIGLEYRIIMEYIDGDLNDEQLIQKLEEKNWQYAKRQLAWLKRDSTINWFPLKDYESISNIIKSWMSDKG